MENQQTWGVESDPEVVARNLVKALAFSSVLVVNFYGSDLQVPTHKLQTSPACQA